VRQEKKCSGEMHHNLGERRVKNVVHGEHYVNSHRCCCSYHGDVSLQDVAEKQAKSAQLFMVMA
jgi:hypothetical protein